MIVTRAAVQLVLLSFVLMALLVLPVMQYASADLGNPNVSVRTRVNITNAAPSVMNVSIDFPATLVANSTALIFCNVSVRDFNNISDLSHVNVSFFSTVLSGDLYPDFNRTHYSNVTCTNFTDQSEFTRSYNCGLQLNYNAVAGNWTCNATVADLAGVKGVGFSTTTINDLIAIGVDDLIDFGQMVIDNGSSNIPFNVTNYGNLPLNVTVFGYGATENDSAAMVCDQGNISIENLYVSSNDTALSEPIGFPLMMQLNSSNATRKMILNLTLAPFNNTIANATNTTVWRLFASSANGASGLCNGTVVFTAIRA